MFAGNIGEAQSLETLVKGVYKIKKKIYYNYYRSRKMEIKNNANSKYFKN